VNERRTDGRTEVRVARVERRPADVIGNDSENGWNGKNQTAVDDVYIIVIIYIYTDYPTGPCRSSVTVREEFKYYRKRDPFGRRGEKKKKN